MFYTYILYSAKLDKFYIGFSQNPQNKVIQHNSDLNKKWTKRGQPQEIVMTIEFQSKTDAMKAEEFIKNQKSRKFIEKLILKGWNHSFSKR